MSRGKYFTWYNTLNIATFDDNNRNNNNKQLAKHYQYERIALIFMTILTAFGLYQVPSWSSSFLDPCHLASIACGVTVACLYATRFLGTKALMIEPILLTLFLAGMPLVYIASWLVTGGASSAWLGVEILGLPLYVSLAVLGLKRSPWFLVVGIAAHGIAWDSWHYSHSAYIPNWYAIGCLLADVSISTYIATRIPTWRTWEQSR